MVDLPGYGDAQFLRQKEKNSKSMIHKYLNNRKNLICLFVLIDIRHKSFTIY